MHTARHTITHSLTHLWGRIRQWPLSDPLLSESRLFGDQLAAGSCIAIVKKADSG
jgi:hypothetical protein